MNQGELVGLQDIIGRVKGFNKKKLEYLVSMYFRKVKGGPKNLSTFLEPDEAKKVESIATNLEKLDPLLTINEAAKEIGIGSIRLRKVVYHYGVQHILTDTIDEKLEVSYKRSTPRSYPEPIIPYIRWLENTNMLLTQDVVSAFKEAINKLKTLKQDQKDTYSSYRLAEAFLMKNAYSAEEFSKESSLPLEFVLEKMHRFHKHNRFKKSLWRGLINPYYIEKKQFENLKKELMKIHDSYSIPEITGMFNLDRRLIKEILMDLKGKDGFTGIFTDKIYGLRTSKNLIDKVDVETAKLREILLNEQKIIENPVLNVPYLSKHFGVKEHTVRRRLKWLHKNGYKEHIFSSYFRRPFISEEIIGSDNFVDSIFSEEIRKKYYYTNLEINKKFPHISDYRINNILNMFKQKKSFEGRIRYGSIQLFFVEKELIDGHSSLYTYLTRQNKVMESKPDYIEVKTLKEYSNISQRSLRNKLEGLSKKYRSSIILVGNSWYVQIKKLHQDTGLRDKLSLHTLPEMSKKSSRKRRVTVSENEICATLYEFLFSVVKEDYEKINQRNDFKEANKALIAYIENYLLGGIECENPYYSTKMMYRFSPVFGYADANLMRKTKGYLSQLSKGLHMPYNPEVYEILESVMQDFRADYIRYSVKNRQAHKIKLSS